MECTKGQHWGICRVKEQQCDQLKFNIDLGVTIQDYEFKIPLDNMATYVKQGDTFYCQTQIALLAKTENLIVLGGAFFTSFLGIFDVENERIGFAENRRALPGSSISYRPSDIVKPEPTTNMEYVLVATIVASVVAGLLICGGKA